ALKDAKTLFVMSKDLFARALLEEVYQNNEYPGFRREAGEALGYSGLRIFVHEHPVAATITGIAAIAATTYTAIQYLS
ncbi:MAG: hypothetical protein KJ922_01460, partial [Nanoarchaeota archaeon]|nr:hypothetical protein [Nanoarchaeota archaeon]